MDNNTENSIEWITMPEKGLNGHILFLGSIGTGKTAGMLIPTLVDHLNNFDKRPTILALDTKANFISDLLATVKEKNLESELLRIRLGGSVTLNPVFSSSPLKNANFIEIAQKIRAASVNFMGKSSESPFWDISAFNLTKNCVVFCAVKHGYFTLKEIYSSLVKAINAEELDELTNELSKALDSDEFDEEEKYNINCALQYFLKEFGKLDSKIKTSILATASAFLNMFQEYQASKLFCPSEEELVIRDFSEIIESGKIIVFDVQKEGLSRAMGTYVKLLYLDAVLNRGKASGSTSEVSDEDNNFRNCLVIADEYQDIVTAGIAGGISDVSALAKGRSKKLIFIAATQSYSSIYNAISNDKASDELIQNFRTKLCGHTSDIKTINNFKELVGKIDIERQSHSISEMSQKATKSYIMEGFDSEDANITESVSSSVQNDYEISARDFLGLKTFEVMGFVYDGISTKFIKRLFLKPHYLVNRATAHTKVLESLMASVAIFAICLFSSPAQAMPNICTVINTMEFNSCMQFNTSGCTCGSWYAPRPCARVSYYIPSSFIEVFPHAKQSYFSGLPGAAIQLSTLGKLSTPYGAESDNGSYSFHSHSLAIPFNSIMNMLSCGGARSEKMCFDGMSEHVSSHWKTGSADLLQPKYLAWSLSPKACLLKGAATSITGGGDYTFSGEGFCSMNMNWQKKFLPSNHSTCNGWGFFFPRSGTYTGTSQMAGSLMIAARMRSLSAEVFYSMPTSPTDKYQLISPQSSSCFKEGQNMSILELPKRVNELGRLRTGKLNGVLLATWKRVSCCVDYWELPVLKGMIAALKGICKGVK